MNMHYFDWAATAPPDPDVLQEGLRCAVERFGNPSSIHPLGDEAARLLVEARERCARALGIDPSAVVFTSGGTEANGIVLFSLLQRRERGHLIVSSIEHASVYEPVRTLERMGFRISWVRPGSDGRIVPEDVVEQVRDDTLMICVLLVNNETGAVQPVGDIVRAVRENSRKGGRRIHIHTDAVQALAKVPFSLTELGVDSASFSAHKIGGPRGVGMLARFSPLQPLAVGGGQESGLRPGTENLPGIHAMSLALEKSTRSFGERYERARDLSRILRTELSGLPGCTTIPAERSSIPEDLFSPWILDVSFPPVPGEVLVRVLGDRGFAVSTGSACSSKKKGRTRVLEGMGIPERIAFSAVRISFGPATTEADIRELADTLGQEIGMLQQTVRQR